MLEFSLMNGDIVDSLTSFCSGYKEFGYKKGDIVIRGDDEPTGVYLIKSGIVKMSSMSEEGDELSVNIFKPGTFFPMAWAISDIDNHYNYQTITSSRLIRVPKEEFIAFLRDNPEVLYDLTRRILIGLDGLVFDMQHLIGGKSESKVAVILYMLAKRFGITKGLQTEIDLPLTHGDLSRFIGLTRETTTIAINKLVKDGLIAQKQRRIVVKDMESLKSYF